MSEVTVSPAGAGDSSSSVPDGSSGSRWRLALPSAVLAFCVLLGGSAWWLTHPQTFEDSGSYGTMRGPVTTNLFDSQVSVDHDVTLRSVRPVVTRNESMAQVSVVMCTPGPIGRIGGIRDTVANGCARSVPPSGRRLGRARPGSPYLLLVVTPRLPGTVSIQGFDIAYTDGLRRGTQRTGLSIDVVAAS